MKKYVHFSKSKRKTLEKCDAFILEKGKSIGDLVKSAEVLKYAGSPAVVEAEHILRMHDLNERLKRADYERRKKNY